jgi:MFS family permease
MPEVGNAPHGASGLPSLAANRSLFADRDFRLLFGADVASKLGTQVTLWALPLIAAVVLRATPLQVGLLTAAQMVAFLLIGLPAGAWVDRLRRRHILIVSDLGRFVLLASIPVAWGLGLLGMPQLYVVALLTGALTVFFDVARQSYLPHLIGRDRLMEGNARFAAVDSTAQVSGPALAGYLIQLLTAPVAIVTNALSYVISATSLMAIRPREPRPERAAHRHLGREVGEGLRYVFGHRLLRPVAVATGTFNLFANVRNTMLIVVLAGELRLPAGAIGLVMAFLGVGGLLGSLVARRVADRLGPGRAIWIPLAAAAPFVFLVPLVRAGWWLWLVGLALGVSGIAIACYNITQLSLRQRVTPERLLGRMNATMRFLVWGTLPVGSTVGGLIGQYATPRTALWAAAAGLSLSWLPVFASPLRALADLPPAPEPSAETQLPPAS